MRINKQILVVAAGLIWLPLAAQQRSVILEEIVARVNNDAITKSELERARAQMREELRQECASCTPQQLTERIAAQERDLLRDLIDNLLMVQRGKDMGINIDNDVIKRLDDIRVQNSIPSMEELERRIEQSGVSFQDFKDNVRNQILQQEVIRREVGGRILLDKAEVLKYYEDHKSEFVRPEQVVLREIFVSTEGKPEAELPALKQKAEGLLKRVKDGEDFGELAKRFSDGSTAKQGGELGTFERGQLAKDLEDKVFAMKPSEVTEVMPSKTGFLVIQVREHYAAGLQPEEKVESEIMSRLYDAKVRPAMREYLAKLREEAFVDVKSGYVDTAGIPGTQIQEVAPSPERDDGDSKETPKPAAGASKNGA